MLKTENNIGLLHQRAIGILHRYGLWAFAKGMFLYLLANGLKKDEIVVCSNDCSTIPDIRLNLDGLEMKTISSPIEVNSLIAQGFSFDNYNTFYRDVYDLKATLGKGSVLFAAFVKKDLASIVWVAFNEKARRDIDNMPYKVNYELGETCHGGSETFPQYRNRGIHSYNLCRMYRFLKEKGIVLDRHAQVEKKGMLSTRIERYGSKVYARGILIRILVWSFWCGKSYEVEDAII
jgi:hypothetical protein